jgi:hypothetical protein
MCSTQDASRAYLREMSNYPSVKGIVNPFDAMDFTDPILRNDFLAELVEQKVFRLFAGFNNFNYGYACAVAFDVLKCVTRNSRDLGR